MMQGRSAEAQLDERAERPSFLEESYRPPWWLRNGHLHTVYPTLFRPRPRVSYRRERIATPDGDLLDIDWSEVGSKRLALVCHGLESSSRAKYVLGMVRASNHAGWDALAMNMRGCGGEPNLLPRSYHSGATEDLAAIVAHLQRLARYESIALIGFSLGGNLVLKYAGELGRELPATIRSVAAISAPCDLEAGARRLEHPANWLYQWRFVQGLKARVRLKCRLFPDRFDWREFRGVRSVWEFDEVYTAPVHGFADATDYYRRCSSKPLLERIAVPTLLLSAKDDPFLPEECFPFREASVNPMLRLMVPWFGGHVGFVDEWSCGNYWSEGLVVGFLNEFCEKVDW